MGISINNNNTEHTFLNKIQTFADYIERKELDFQEQIGERNTHGHGQEQVNSLTKKKGRMGLKSSGGEIIQVQGGHIIRATGRKDRHSKVITAKGPRDRRVRLAAHTAIQFYDVQDRLGYDRPSKAVDWLIKKAKASIDKLAELPPWDPSSSAGVGDQDHVRCTEIPVADHTGGGPDSSPFGYGSLDDSIKSFFPTTNTSEEHPAINFQNYPQSQDLCLSLHTSLQDPGPGSMGFDGGWSDPQTHHDLGRFTRLMGWAGGDQAASGRGGNGNGILFNPSLMAPPPPPQPPPQGAYSFQRSTLQSSLSPLFVQHQHQHQHQHHHHHLHSHSSTPGLEAFMGFSIPSHQIHGGTSMSNTASSSSLSPDSSQH